MLRNNLRALWVAIALSIACVTAAADGIDGPDMYVYIDVSVREITVEGMRQRLALLQSNEYSAEADNAIDTQTRVQIADVYVQFNTSPGAHVGYGTRNAAQVAVWLEAHPDWQSRYAALDTQFQSLSSQLSALRPVQ